MPPVNAGHPSKAPGKVFKVARKEMIIAAQNKLNAVSVPVILWRQMLEKAREKLARVV
jgi:hypothetical protein